MMSARSQVYRPVDDAQGNWVINCFYIDKDHLHLYPHGSPEINRQLTRDLVGN